MAGIDANAKVLRDAESVPIPQRYNPDTKTFDPILTGEVQKVTQSKDSHVSIEKNATFTEASSPFDVNHVSVISHDGAETEPDIQFNFDAAIGTAGTITLKPGESLTDFPRIAKTLTYKTLSTGLVADTMGFAGKVKGSLTSNPHLAAAFKAATFTKAFASASEFSDTSYGNFTTEGDGKESPSSSTTAGQYVQFLFQFNVLEHLNRKHGLTLTRAKALEVLESIELVFVGRGSGANAGAATNGVTLKLLNATTGNFSDVGNNTSAGNSKISYKTSANLIDYVDANGLITMVAHDTYPADATVGCSLVGEHARIVIETADMKNVPFRAWGV